MPKVLRTINEPGRYSFYCPGCKCYHSVNSGWTFNGDMDNPTFSPSVLVRSGHYSTMHEGDCWCTYDAKHPNKPSGYKCTLCHSYVTNGQIRYLDDCTHELKGQTIDMQDED